MIMMTVDVKTMLMVMTDCACGDEYGYDVAYGDDW